MATKKKPTFAIKFDDEQYDYLLYKLIDINNTGCSLQANIEGEYKDDAGSIATDLTHVTTLLGIDLDAEAKRLGTTLSTYVEEDDDE